MGPPKPWKEVRGFGRVLDLSKPPVVIDEPGLYAIQQSWLFPPATTDVVPELIQITADDVTLDLHGFRISADIRALRLSTLLLISGDRAEIRNGRFGACCDAAVAVASTGAGTNLHHLTIYSFEPMTFDGDFTTIRDSGITPHPGIQLAGRSNLERNAIFCSFICAVLSGDGNRVTDNRMYPYQFGGVRIMGNENVVANNIMDAREIAQLVAGFDVEGDHNVLRSNTVLVGFSTEAVLRISGTANTLEGNIGAPNESEWEAGAGIKFTADGNYYGNNRMAARTPFLLGGTVQTDWGGNVGY